jgi:hypothetical protein
MTDRRRTVDDILVDSHTMVVRLQAAADEARAAADEAIADRARTFAVAQQRYGRSSGDISRLLGPAITPGKVGAEIRIGRRLNEIQQWRRKTTA